MGLPSTQPAGSSSLSSSSYRHNNNHHGEEDDFKKPFDSSATATTAHGSVAAPPFVAPTSSSLSTYLSLVQQYLSVFMVDNATFFAERCAAEHPGHPDAVYLLALCYHRSGSPRRARITLEGGGSGSGGGGVVTTSGSSSSSSVAAIAASSPTPAMRYLSARCSYELGDYGRAETALLWECRRHYGRYRGDLSMDDWIAQTTPCPVPNGAAGLALLGSICRKSNRTDRAITYFRLSLQLDPFLWTSFEALAELNAPDLRAGDVFGVESALVTAAASVTTAAFPSSSGEPLGSCSLQGLPPLQTPAPASSFAHKWGSFATGGTIGAAAPSFAAPQTSLASSSMSVVRPRGNLLETPGLTPIPVQNSFLHFQATPPPAHPNHHHLRNPPSSAVAASATATTHTPTPSHPIVLRRAREVASRQYYPPSPETPLTHVTRSMRYLRGLGPTMDDRGTTTTTTSAMMAAASSAATNAGGRSLFLSTENSQAQRRGISSTTAGNSSHISAYAPPNYPAGAKDDNHMDADDIDGKDRRDERQQPQQQSVHAILELLSVAGAAYQRLCEYRCRDALDLLRSLPPRHQMTGWALHQQGRALLELNEFQDAQRCLELMQSKDPGRIRGLELLSTVYWQMKKEVELSYLSQKVVDMDRLAPEAWCVVGNCFSLQKDHESALVFFKRSLQLDYGFTYTHTLSGYEYMANENFNEAIGCFRQALRIDDRHYNAWYGLGAIYHRQEKYDLAEYHFGKAVQINPGSSVLRCNLGIAQNANGKPYQALDTLAGAFRLDPRNPQARFQRATIYSALNRPEEALEELRRVRDAAPREATIHFAMGKVLKRLGRPEEAMKCFLTAMDLDPKENQTIKSAMDKLDEPDVDEEAMSTF